MTHGMIEVKVRLHDEAHVFRPHADRATLVDAILARIHDGIVDVDHRAPVGALVERSFEGVAAVDHDIALGMLDQEPRNWDLEIALALMHLDVFRLGAERTGLEHLGCTSDNAAPIAPSHRQIGTRRKVTLPAARY